MKPWTTSTMFVALVFATAAWSPALAQPGHERATPPAGQQDRETRAERLLEDRVFVRLAEEAWAGGDFKVEAQARSISTFRRPRYRA